MRKSLKIVLASSVLLIIVGLLLCLYFFVINKDDNIYVEEISLSENQIILKVDDVYSIANIMRIVPANYNVQIMCYAENSNYVSIIEGNKIKAKHVGETKVVIKALSDKDSYVNEILNINVISKPIYPDNFTFATSKVALEINKRGENKIVPSRTFTAQPIVSYTVNGICTYNYLTGEILALNLGSTFVKVKFETESSSIENSFEVIVTNNKAKIVLLDCTFENNEYSMSVKKSELSRLYFNLYDAQGNKTKFDINTNVIVNNSNCEVVSHELSCIKFVCDSVGESVIRIFSVNDETVFVDVKIIVGE